MPDAQAKIIVGASEVAGDRRHTYLLFEHSNGDQVVVRGGPDGRSQGSDLANFAESTILGSNKFGNIRVDAAPYEPPYDAVFRRAPDGSVTPIHADRADLGDPALVRDGDGRPVVQEQTSPDWPGPGEHHERLTVWKGTDAELQAKLDTALKSGQQINQATLEYSPLNNNSNGVTSNLLKSVGVVPELPKGKNGEAVRAPDFGDDLYKDVGVASHRSGNRFDGKHWYDDNGKEIQPPRADQPTTAIEPAGGKAEDSLNSKSSAGHNGTHEKPAHADMRDPSHHDHAMFLGAYRGVAEIDRGMGRIPDEHSERLAAAVTAQGKADGLQSIHHVVMNDDRSRAYAVDTLDMAAPWSKRSSVDVATAVNQPVDASNEKLQATNVQLSVERSNQPTITPNDPGVAGPRLA